MIASINRKELRRDWPIADNFEILLVIAMGNPKETVVLESVGPDGDIKYWRDEKDIHHVPKRSLVELIVG